jgi:hypothetical protein
MNLDAPRVVNQRRAERGATTVRVHGAWRLTVKRPRTYTQAMRQSRKGSSARIESKGARVPRRGDRPLRRAQCDASEIHGEETPHGLEQGERMEEGRVRIRSYAPRSGSPRGLRQSLCARRTRLRCARRAGCCEEDGPGRWGPPNSRRERCSAADGRARKSVEAGFAARQNEGMTNGPHV